MSAAFAPNSPILTEVALVVGGAVLGTRYDVTGTPDFGQSVLEVLDGGGVVVILKNHGLICFGQDFGHALGIAEAVEEAARAYVHALAANGGREPDLVSADLIPEMRARFLTTQGQ